MDEKLNRTVDFSNIDSKLMDNLMKFTKEAETIIAKLKDATGDDDAKIVAVFNEHPEYRKEIHDLSMKAKLINEEMKKQKSKLK